MLLKVWDYEQNGQANPYVSAAFSVWNWIDTCTTQLIALHHVASQT